MNNTQKQSTDEIKPERKGGFFSRLFQKMDNAMKQSAEKKSQKSKCCGSDSKGDKCC